MAILNPVSTSHIPLDMPIKVAIVEDDAGVRECLTVVLNGTNGFRCVGSYGNAESALKNLPSDWPDAVLMDINLPQMSGIDLVAKLKALRPALHVIMLTVYVDSEQIFKSLQAGANGYLIKQTPPSQILEALVDVLQGGSPMSSMIARKVVQYFQQKQAPSETANLTKREHEILGLVAKGRAYKEIGDALSISALTVKTHVRNIYEKLHVRSQGEAVAKFFGGGQSTPKGVDRPQR
ncbi:MAG: two component transcriptional regulator, LuxR family [Verrucomicrobiales bacterium]|nr:two component transcriptional regulator, LuxR family [Verrucomicrobiales bacterium]